MYTIENISKFFMTNKRAAPLGGGSSFARPSYIYTSHYTFWTQIYPGPTALALWANFFRFEICCLHDFFQIPIFVFSKIFLHNQSNDQNVTI